MSQQIEATALDPTLDSVSPEASSAPIPARSRRKSKRVAIVAGSSPELSGETYDLLRRRLRAVSLLFLAGFAAFFIRALFDMRHYQSKYDWAIFWTHLGITLLMGLFALRLCTNCPRMLRHLRLAELLIFGAPAAFFVLISHEIITQTPYRSILPIWLMLLFTYAMFIPNSLKRAGVVIGLMAAAPLILITVCALTHDEFRDALSGDQQLGAYLVESYMFMTLAAVSAVWGANTMGMLRKEAFEAKQLGHYRLKQELGKGGMGEVYLAEHLMLKRPCAIKLIRADKAGDVRALARFEREVKATAKLTHWNTIEIYDYGRADDGTFYYVMEYLPGLTLAQLVESCGALPPERAIHLLTQTCDALDEAHCAELVHRDIKPANIFAANRGGVYDVAKLLDFGLAKPLSNFTDTSITAEGTITGSPLFMSPEQVSGEINPDARSDIYSLGVVAYYLVAGVPPFDQRNPMAVMVSHTRDQPVPPTQHDSRIPGDLEEVILRCLEKDPDRRFQDAKSLRQALENCQSAGAWTREMAINWWECHGCPKKKALDRSVFLQASA